LAQFQTANEILTKSVRRGEQHDRKRKNTAVILTKVRISVKVHNPQTAKEILTKACQNDRKKEKT